MHQQTQVGILLFNEVEFMDFAGPFEVFSITEKDKLKLFSVSTIAETANIISARNGLKVAPDFTFQNHPNLDILIIPGGYGAEHIEFKNRAVLDWVRAQAVRVNILASVCTGAFILAEAGLLDGKKVTTHWMDCDRLENEYPKTEVIRTVSFIDEGALLTSGGISSGINMSFHIIERLHGKELAKRTAKRMEYPL